MYSMTIPNQQNQMSIFLDASKDFSAYKRYVMNIPNLSEEEEINCVANFRMNNCLQSAQKLIVSHLKAVVKVAVSFKGYGFPEEDLVQEGNIGLMKAVKFFNPDKGARLVTYALIWIKAEIQGFILKNYKMVKLATTKNLKKLFFNFNSLRKDLLNQNVQEKDVPKLIAKELDLPIKDVYLAESYFREGDVFIDQVDDDGHEIYTVSTEENPETFLIRKEKEEFLEKIKVFINSLPEREKVIIEKRYLTEEKLTHKELSIMLGVSSERVRQIEEKIILKMKETFNLK